jgi:hypothetical protein
VRSSGLSPPRPRPRSWISACVRFRCAERTLCAQRDPDRI